MKTLTVYVYTYINSVTSIVMIIRCLTSINTHVHLLYYKDTSINKLYLAALTTFEVTSSSLIGVITLCSAMVLSKPLLRLVNTVHAICT